MPLPPKLAALLARLPTGSQLLSLVVPGIFLVGAGVYTYRHYASGGGSRSLLAPELFKEDWAAHARETMRMLREYEAAQRRARAETGACGDAATYHFSRVSTVPYDFDDLVKDESGGPLGGQRCGLAANPRKPTPDAWVYLLLIEDGAGEILMAQYESVGARLSAWPTAEQRAKFRALGAGIGTTPAAPAGVLSAAAQAQAQTQGPAVPAVALRSEVELISARTKLLLPILGEINEEGLPMGVKFKVDDLLPVFRDTERRLMAGSLDGFSLEEAGLNPPATEPLDADDEKSNAAVKCLIGGEWRYMNALPPSSEGGVTECRRRDRGKDKRGFDIPAWHIFDQWSPTRAVWSSYSDEEYAQAVEQFISLRLEALPDSDPEKHAEKLQARYARWDRLRRSGGQAAISAESALRAELLAPYEKRIRIAAARLVVELITGARQQ